MRLALSGWSCYVTAGMAAIMLIALVIRNPWGWRGLWVANALIIGGMQLPMPQDPVLL